MEWLFHIMLDKTSRIKSVTMVLVPMKQEPFAIRLDTLVARLHGQQSYQVSTQVRLTRYLFIMMMWIALVEHIFITVINFIAIIVVTMKMFWLLVTELNKIKRAHILCFNYAFIFISTYKLWPIVSNICHAHRCSPLNLKEFLLCSTRANYFGTLLRI